MKNDKKTYSKKRNLIYVLIVLVIVAIAIIGWRYFASTGTLYSGACDPLSGQCGGASTSTTCSCNWNMEFACGISPETNLECKTAVFWNGWWKKCQCNPSGCGGMCEDSPEGTEICRNSALNDDPHC